MSHIQGPRIIVALDVSTLQELDKLLNELDPQLCRVKVGKELFTTFGPDVVTRIMRKNFEVFLDLKFHDIPNTTSHAVKAAADMGVWMVNVHASGGRKMMEACRNILDNYSSPPLLIAVTILTSLSGEELEEIGFANSTDDAVFRLAQLAQSSGMDGVVCSALEAPTLKGKLGQGFCLVTPGIRPLFTVSKDDQSRVVAPKQAIENGSHYLVIGRPITQSGNPSEVLTRIVSELE